MSNIGYPKITPTTYSSTTPNIYYSFNVPDKNLYNNIQNWATGYPIYDASLNNSYISRQHFKLGNGSLEMPKNRFTLPTTNQTITKTAKTLSVAVSDNQLRMVLCEYGGAGGNDGSGSVLYRTRADINSQFSNSNTITNSSSKIYYRVALTGDGNRLVTCVNNNGFVYFSTWNGTIFPSLTQTNDITQRDYYGLAITKDGSRMVASTNTSIFFTNWNGTNYDQFIQTLETNVITFPNIYLGIGISSNGDRICYGNNSSVFRLSYWNGSNYNDSVIARTVEGKIARTAFFNNDSSLLFLSYIANSTTSIDISTYNYNTNSYDFSCNIPTTAIPASLDLHGLWCVDTATSCTIYAAAYDNTTLYITDILYNTSGNYSYCNANANAIQIGSTPGTSGLTFAFWFRSNYNLTWARIFDFGNGAPSNNILIGILNNHLCLSISKEFIQTQPDFINYNINDNQWYHAVVTLACSDTTNPSNTCVAYINGGGTLNTNQFSNSTYYYPNIINRTNNYIGRSNWISDPQFFGNIDDFRIYSTVLTPSQVLQLYNSTGLTNNYRNSTVYRLYNVPVETSGYDLIITNMGINKTYFYWNDPNAGANQNGVIIYTGAINNRSNPYNFKYTYNNIFPYAQVKVIFICDDRVTLKVNGSNIFSNGTWANIYTQQVSLVNGNNLFEFIVYNSGGPAVFAAYITTIDDVTYLFSTDYTMNNWTVETSGFFSNGYPMSSILTNQSGIAKTDVATTYFRSQNLDLSNNRANRQVPQSNLFFQTNNNDFKNIFFNYA
jgi:hypothetical protein